MWGILPPATDADGWPSSLSSGLIVVYAVITFFEALVLLLKHPTLELYFVAAILAKTQHGKLNSPLFPLCNNERAVALSSRV